MTKAEIISLIREQIETKHNIDKKKISLKLISIIIDTFFLVLKDNISKGEHIELRGFGTFETKIREPKNAINPRTKKPVKVKRHAVPYFRPGKELKSMVREYFDKKLSD